MKMEHDGTKPQGSWGRGSAEGAEIEQNDLAMENIHSAIRHWFWERNTKSWPQRVQK